MSPAYVELVMHNKRSGHVAGDHCHAVGLRGAWSVGDLSPADHGTGCGRVRVNGLGGILHLYRSVGGSDSEGKMETRFAGRRERQLLSLRNKIQSFDIHCIGAQWHVGKSELAG